MKRLIPAAALAAVLAVAPSALAAGPAFAPAGSATIHPGVMTYTDGSQCTSNFVFYDAGTVYLGQAAHCSGLGSASETDGCQARSLPLGTEVEVTGASRPGRLAYNSWLAMQGAGETDADACAFNDFALIAIDPADVAKVSPAVPTFGIPTGLNTTGVDAGDRVSSYGNSELRLGITFLSPKRGISLGQNGGGWTHDVLTVTPGIPGDSGSGFLDAEGRAFGVLSTLAILPLPGTNGVSDLGRALTYARTHGGPDVVLADTAARPAPGVATTAATKAAAAKKKAAAKKAAAKKRAAAKRRAAAARKRAAARKATARRIAARKAAARKAATRRRAQG